MPKLERLEVRSKTCIVGVAVVAVVGGGPFIGDGDGVGVVGSLFIPYTAESGTGVVNCAGLVASRGGAGVCSGWATCSSRGCGPDDMGRVTVRSGSGVLIDSSVWCGSDSGKCSLRKWMADAGSMSESWMT